MQNGDEVTSDSGNREIVHEENVDIFSKAIGICDTLRSAITFSDN